MAAFSRMEEDLSPSLIERAQDELTEALREEYIPEFDFSEAVETEYPYEEEEETLADELPEHHGECTDSRFNSDMEEEIGMERFGGLTLFSDLFERVDWASTTIEGLTGTAGMLIGIKIAPFVSTALGRPVNDPKADEKTFGWLRVTGAGVIVFGLGAVVGERVNEWAGLFVTFMGAGLIADGLTKGALHRALYKA